jgi:hypothetical protein
LADTDSIRTDANATPRSGWGAFALFSVRRRVFMSHYELVRGATAVGGASVYFDLADA